MSTKTALKKALEILGPVNMAEGLGVSYQAIYGWRDRNRMPDTEYSGRTEHAMGIEAMTNGQVTVEMLLGHMPVAVERLLAKRAIK
jgi:hypothetical protein